MILSICIHKAFSNMLLQSLSLRGCIYFPLSEIGASSVTYFDQNAVEVKLFDVQPLASRVLKLPVLNWATARQGNPGWTYMETEAQTAANAKLSWTLQPHSSYQLTSATWGNVYEISTRTTEVIHRIVKPMSLLYQITKFWWDFLCSNR